MFTFLIISAKIATLGLLKLKVFWNKGYDVMILSMTSPTKFSHVTQIILWPKFGNCSISMREVIVTPILQGFDYPYF